MSSNVTLFPQSDDANKALEALAEKQVNGWQIRIVELDRIIAEATGERDTLRSKVSAAETILGRSAPVMAVQPAAGQLPRLMEQIEALMRDGYPRSPKEIRKDLARAGVSREITSSTNNNFYNSLGRLIHKKRLWKGADGKYRIGKGKE
jgi:hypothetical protein